uniref:Uncharacterized protein n=1 Tax=Setaria digitata TaxID=48799 RepID=A0A915PJY0_9BILA
MPKSPPLITAPNCIDQTKLAHFIQRVYGHVCIHTWVHHHDDVSLWIEGKTNGYVMKQHDDKWMAFPVDYFVGGYSYVIHPELRGLTLQRN